VKAISKSHAVFMMKEYEDWKAESQEGTCFLGVIADMHTILFPGKSNRGFILLFYAVRYHT